MPDRFLTARRASADWRSSSWNISAAVQIYVYTRQLSYRKKDRAMRPIYGCPEKFLRVLITHPATFPEICNELLFRLILRMCVQKLKFVALPVPEIIGGPKKIWEVPGYAHSPFSPKILKGFCLDGPVKFEVRSFIPSLDNRGYFKKLGSP